MHRPHPLFVPVLALLVAALLPASSLAQPQPPSPIRPARPAVTNPLGGRALKTIPKQEEAPEARATDEDASRRQQGFKNKNVRYSLTFDKTDIVEVVKTISNYTGKNFILPDNLRGKITIISQSKVNADEVYAAFLAALEANNLAVYPVGKKFLKILPKKDAPRTNIPTVVEPDGYIPFNEQIVTMLFRLQHTEADQISGLIKQLGSRDGDVQQVPPDLLIVTDTGLNLHRMQRIIEQIDQAGGSGKIRIIQINYATAADIATKLGEIFDVNTNSNNPAARRTAPPRPAKGRSADGEGELAVSITRAVADERTNKLILVADDKSFGRIQEIIAELDVPTEAEGQVHVHYLENANAEDLASTLANLTSGSSGAGTGRPGRPRNVPRTSDGSVPGMSSAELFSGEVQISADKSTNSLVIVASYGDYKNLKKVIDKLDIPRRQVFVEAVIMEVSLDTTNEFGMNFHTGAAPEVSSGDVAPVVLGTQFAGTNSFSLASLLSLGGFMAGIQGPSIPGTEELGVAIPSFGVVLQALQKDSQVNVLSTPHILTSDNEEAEITVGQNVPFQSGFAPSGVSSMLGNLGGANTQTNISPALSSLAGGLGGLSSFYAPIQRQNVELKLKLTPQINESDFVRLAIEEQTEEIASNDPQLGPTTARRTAKTTIVAKNGQTVVIGGLIQERTIRTVNKVPFFGDIPILGWLFRSNETKKLKTNLLLFLTPYIINGPHDFQRIFQEKLAEREEFVQQFYDVGGGYEASIDFSRRQGPLGHLIQTVDEEALAPENGGPGRGVRVIEPEKATPAPAPEATEVSAAPEAPLDDEGAQDEEGSSEDEVLPTLPDVSPEATASTTPPSTPAS
ncbi:MAG: type II secretion system secretin GspD [Deltaproteobacteria bacterium]|nr:type II secretion system secretin GspD [Deltaproteobacteria bacterium]